MAVTKIIKWVYIVCVVASAATIAHGQSRKDIFDKEIPVTYLGLDLSKAKLIGDRERYGSESDMRRLIDGWNNIFLKEPDKFNVAKAIGREKVTNAIEVTNGHNQELDILALYTDNKDEYVHVKPTDMQEVVSEYDFSALSGLGVMFIIESFSKLNGEGSAWVTFINLDTKEVLMTQRVTGQPGGAGLRNYWANAVHDMLQKIQKKEFDKWRKLYGNP